MTLIFIENLAHNLETKVLQNLHQGCNGLRVAEEVASQHLRETQTQKDATKEVACKQGTLLVCG